MNMVVFERATLENRAIRNAPQSSETVSDWKLKQFYWGIENALRWAAATTPLSHAWDGVSLFEKS